MLDVERKDLDKLVSAVADKPRDAKPNQHY